MTIAVAVFSLIAAAACARAVTSGAAQGSAPAAEGGRSGGASAREPVVHCFIAEEMVRDTVLLSITGSATWYSDHLLVEARSGLLDLGDLDSLRAALAVPTGNNWRVQTLSGSYTGRQIGAGGQIIMPVRFHLAIPRGAVADSVALVFLVSRPLASPFDRRITVPAQSCQPYLAPPSADHVAGSSVPSTHTE